MNKLFNKGFTLIELLVVISIIGVLAAFSYVSYLNSQLAARDTQRRSDLNQYRIKLEQYASNGTGSYSTVQGTVSPYVNNPTSDDICDDISLDPCLSDPSSGSSNGYPHGYYYFVDSAGLNYKMYTLLEAASGWWEICSVGKSGFVPLATNPNPTGSGVTCDL